MWISSLSLSSISAVFGLPGQSNYSSANNFLDKLVTYRKSKGLHAQSINLGVLGQYAGMSKEGGNVLKVLRKPRLVTPDHESGDK